LYTVLLLLLLLLLVAHLAAMACGELADALPCTAIVLMLEAALAGTTRLTGSIYTHSSSNRETFGQHHHNLLSFLLDMHRAKSQLNLG
jgi:hypothetical protein